MMAYEYDGNMVNEFIVNDSDELTTLRARVARLEDALREIEKYNDWPNRVLKIARRALEEK